MKRLRFDPGPFRKRRKPLKRSKYRNLAEECEDIKQHYSCRIQGFRTANPKHRARVERSSGYKGSMYSDGVENALKSFDFSTTTLVKSGKKRVMKTINRANNDWKVYHSKTGRGEKLTII